MSASEQPLQLSLETSPDGIFSVRFRGVSTWNDIPLFQQAIDPHLALGKGVQKVVFDLTEIDPLLNAAGRLLDLACYSFQRHMLPVEIRMPARIYDTLRQIEPARMAEPVDGKALVRGVTVFIVQAKAKPVTLSSTAAVIASTAQALASPKEKAAFLDGAAQVTASGDEVILSCEGKVRAVNGSVVTVSLFTDQEEIIGEFHRRQFSSSKVSPGRMFEYKACVSPHLPGRTIITIELVSQQSPTPEELFEDSQKLGPEFEKF
jgi:hypothetical protein